jgi:metal-sulfur cluster biosynthetic enzyme
MTTTEPPDLWAALHDVPDPETGLDIVDLGLVYQATFDPDTATARVVATFTTPACPAGEMIADGIVRRLSAVPGVGEVELEITFEPRWTPARISAAGRALLGG